MVAAGTGSPERERGCSFLKARSAADLLSFAFEVVAPFFVNHPTSVEALKLTSANGVWINQSLSFKPAFKAVQCWMGHTQGRCQQSFQNQASALQSLDVSLLVINGSPRYLTGKVPVLKPVTLNKAS
ncbi:hypothetical protein CRG98_030942 [Punica granatum]|uniref:Uncharacterized protein n=1 Tax=Punica granatum TaxID=22663 RepID=A0A2I0IXJ2_PUNGR|nr:hypothetical protein CRG98_030942 [Punica granatum]